MDPLTIAVIWLVIWIACTVFSIQTFGFIGGIIGSNFGEDSYGTFLGFLVGLGVGVLVALWSLVNVVFQIIAIVNLN